MLEQLHLNFIARALGHRSGTARSVVVSGRRSNPSPSKKSGSEELPKSKLLLKEHNRPALDTILSILSVPKDGILIQPTIPGLLIPLPELKEYAATQILPEEITTYQDLDKMADRLYGQLKARPDLSAILGLLPSKDGETTIFVASRDDANAESRLEGIYGVLSRLLNSPSIKDAALKYPAQDGYGVCQEDMPSDNVYEMHLPGNQNIQSLGRALLEGGEPNHIEFVKDLVKNLPKGERVVIAIGGPSASGKSTLIKELQEFAGGRKVVPFNGDRYFRNADDPKVPKTPDGRLFWDDPDAMFFDEMTQDVNKLIKEGKAELPVYNFGKIMPGGWQGGREEQRELVELGKDDILVIDSLHAMHPDVIKSLNMLKIPLSKIYLDSLTPEDRLIRRIIRDFNERGREPSQTLKDWDSTTFTGEVMFIRKGILGLNPAKDVVFIRKFKADMELTRKRINNIVTLMEAYGISPSYEAFALKDTEMKEFTKKKAKECEEILASSTSTKEQKEKAHKELKRLKDAPSSVIPKENTKEANPVAPVNKKPDINELVPKGTFMIPASKVKEICNVLNIDTHELMKELINVGKVMAKPPISNYKVGAVGLGNSGNIYMGVNLEFPNASLIHTIHGEQCVVANAKHNGEEGLKAIAISAAPCGHCRQILNEVGNRNLEILVPGESATTLAELLPKDFGPKDLNVEGAVLSPQDHKLNLNDDISKLPSNELPLIPLIINALEAVNASYSPEQYTFDSNKKPVSCPSGVAIRTYDGKIYKGYYLANAAYNPCTLPLQNALISLIADKKDYLDIQDVVLLEKENAPVIQAGETQLLLSAIAPNANFKVYHVE